MAVVISSPPKQKGSSEPALAWHYTIEERAESILRDQILKLATAGVPKCEKPVLWFSLNQDWEPTARKMVLTNNGMRMLSREEMFDESKVGKLYRFGVPVERLHRWSVVKRLARIRKKHEKQLLETARLWKASYMDWCGSMEPIDVSETRIQVFENGVWTDAEN